MIRFFPYAAKQGFRQIFRNRMMSTASIFSITSVLVVLGIFFILVINVTGIAESAKSQFDAIQIYLDKDMNSSEMKEVYGEVKKLEQVDEAVFLTKEDALTNFKEKWGANAYLLDGIEENPLPNSIVIKVKDMDLMDGIALEIEGLEGVEEVKYYKDIMDRLLGITHFIQMIGIVVIVILVIISTIIVANTIKLTVVAREKEINIMKYVGASNWFIRGPFLVEGMLIGFIGAVISLSIVAVGYTEVVKSFTEKALVMFSVYMIEPMVLSGNLAWIFISLGVGIGSIGSVLSMRKFLDV